MLSVITKSASHKKRQQSADFLVLCLEQKLFLSHFFDKCVTEILVLIGFPEWLLYDRYAPFRIKAGCIMATDAEVRIRFVAYDDEKAASGYRFNYSTVGSSIRDHKGMWDEDPDYIAPEQQQEGIESIQPSADSIQKVLIDGQIYILRGGAMYNLNGIRIR